MKLNPGKIEVQLVGDLTDQYILFYMGLFYLSMH